MGLKRLTLSAVATLLCCHASAFAVVLWTSHHGETRIALNRELLQKAGLTITSDNPDDAASTSDTLVIEVAPDRIPFIMSLNDGVANGFSEGLVRHLANVRISRGSQTLALTDLILGIGDTDSRPSMSGLAIAAPAVSFDNFHRAIGIAAEDVTITPNLATLLGDPDLAGASIGRLTSEVFLAWSGGELPPPNYTDDDPMPRACASPNLGPDVIVGDIQGTASYGAPIGGISAFSLGTYSCNIGNVPVRWQSGNNLHPAIPQSIYRYKTVNGAGRFEQIGASWCKHGFTALSDTICCPCTGPGGSQLGVGCADPYTAGRNGGQLSTTGGLGPRFDINAHTGVFTFPYPFRNTNGSVPVTSITRRIQVPTTDLDPAQNAGALYYGEAQYVTQDDAAWNNSGIWSLNANNNCSYRRLLITQSGSSYNAAITASTVRGDPAIKAWKANDPAVTETNLDTPEIEFPANSGNKVGRVVLSAKATDLGGGVYHYEYAIFNMNSDRSISSVSIPLGASLTATNIGFHDVAHHSGDGFGSTPTAQIDYDGTDWPGAQSGGAVNWTMVNATPVENSNALRWGTMYNFRFDVAAPPTTGNITLGMFKPVAGLADSVAANTVIPSVPCDALVVGPIADTSASCVAAWTSPTPNVTGGLPPYTWSFVGTPPPGMTINPNTGVISWPNPRANGVPYSITVRAAGSCGAGTDTFLLAVRCSPGSPIQLAPPQPG